jgi:hypothetical protein
VLVTSIAMPAARNSPALSAHKIGVTSSSGAEAMRKSTGAGASAPSVPKSNAAATKNAPSRRLRTAGTAQIFIGAAEAVGWAAADRGLRRERDVVLNVHDVGAVERVQIDRAVEYAAHHREWARRWSRAARRATGISPRR